MKSRGNRKFLLTALNWSMIIILILIVIILISGGFAFSIFGIKIKVFSVLNPTLILIIILIIKLIFDKTFFSRIKNLSPPSSGFIYLVIVFIFSILFFSWAVQKKWYDRINTSEQTEKDIKKWNAHQNKIMKYQTEKKLEMDKKQNQSFMNELDLALQRVKSNPNDIGLQDKVIKFYYLTGEKDKSCKSAKNLINKNIITTTAVYVLFQDLWDNPSEKKRSELIDILLKENLPRKRIFVRGVVEIFGFSPSKKTLGGIKIKYKGAKLRKTALNIWSKFDNPLVILVQNKHRNPVKPVIQIQSNLLRLGPVKTFIYTGNGRIISKIPLEKPTTIELSEVSAY